MTFWEAAAAVIGAGWSALTGFVYPGTSLSLASIFIGAFVAAISINVAGNLLGVRYSFGRVRAPYKSADSRSDSK